MTKRVALVTGGSSGIGRACVVKFLEEGWEVILAYFPAQHRPNAEALVQIGEAQGRRVVPILLDVTDDAACRAVAEQAQAVFGRIDALVSSAGTTRMVASSDLDGLSKDDFLQTCAVNTAGPFLIARACAPLLTAADGAVVIVSSYGAIIGSGSSIAYAASKGAANTLTMALARVLAPRVRVNAVCPALTAGGFVARDTPDIYAQRKSAQEQRAPLRRIAQPEEVAENIYWLAAIDRLMTGHCLMLDCGLHLNGDV